MAVDPSTEALALFAELLAGETFPSVAVDITDSDYALPDPSGNPLYGTVTPLTNAELTEKTVDGDGTFDVLMASIKAHIIEEYDEGRITGKEYSETYIALVTAALGNATQFLINRDTAYHQNLLVQMQARTAEIQAVIAAATLAKERQSIVANELNVLTTKTEYALGKMRLATEDVTYSKIEQDVLVGIAQEAQIDAEAGIAGYKLSDIMPEEKRQIVYTTDYVLESQVSKTNYETDNLLVKQNSILAKDLDIKTYQHSTLMIDQHNLLAEQIQVQRAQTLDTRVDGTTPVTGAIGKQKELYSEQISSYVKDARYKGAKIWTDAWIAQKSLDEGLLSPDEFTNANINEVLSSLKDNLGLEPA